MPCVNCGCQACVLERDTKLTTDKKCPLCKGVGKLPDEYGWYPCICVKFGARTG